MRKKMQFSAMRILVRSVNLHNWRPSHPFKGNQKLTWDQWQAGEISYWSRGNYSRIPQLDSTGNNKTGWTCKEEVFNLSTWEPWKAGLMLYLSMLECWKCNYVWVLKRKKENKVRITKASKIISSSCKNTCIYSNITHTFSAKFMLQS